MRIVLIGTVASSFYGFRAELIKRLVNLNHDVYAFTSDYNPDDITKIRNLGAIPIPYSLSRGGLNPVRDIKSTITLAKQIKKIAPDIVFSYFSKPVIFGTLAAKIAKVPRIVGMLEGLGYTFTEQPNGISLRTKTIQYIQIFLYKLALPKLDNLIFLNNDDPKDLLVKNSITVKSFKVLGGIGLNLNEYPYSPPPDFNNSISFLFIGRLIKEKGVYDFISAAKQIKKNYPYTRFVILGKLDSSNPGSLTESELNELISSDIIQYPGHVDNIAEWIAQCHVFVLPSYYREGVPRSTQEAMAIGRPIITTNVPGCKDTVVNNINGFLVPKWDPQSLAKRMQYFIDNPTDITLMGLESHRIAKEFFDSEIVNKKLLSYLGVYD